MLAGIVPDDRGALEAALRDALADADLVVVSAGSSVGARDETAGAVAALGEIWCHGLAIKPGKPTLLAECARRAADRAARQPAVRAGGVPAGRRAAGVAAGRLRAAAARADRRAPGSCRDLASATGRLDVVQVAVRDGVAEPLFGPSALLSVLTRADGYLVVPSRRPAWTRGTEVEVILYR